MKRILVVDDEADVASLFIQRFRREIKDGNYEFNFANSGEDALQFMAAHNHEAILILSDINMPGMSGLELLRRIKQHYVAPPPVVMMITAYGDDQSKTDALSMGADDFFTKPLDFNLLKEKLAAI
jgi:two-component system, chemotaxis family, chemotaxis protein CheY